MTAEIAPFEAPGAAGRLSGEQTGEGPPVVLLHGLSATRRYVVHRSKALPRAGFQTIAYDARGHGESDPPAEDPGAYEYADLVADLAAIVDEFNLERAALAGVSMGAHTALRFALENPERVSALVVITPGSTGEPPGEGRWDAMADALEEGGIEGFIESWGARDVAAPYRESVIEFARQRLSLHRDLAAVARALRVVPRSVPFEGLDALERIEVPTLVVGSRDEADPMHPLAIAESYAEHLPNAELLVEEEGKAPIAWQGARLSRAIAGFLGD